MPPVRPYSTAFCSSMAWSRSSARITPSTGPKHSVWWNHEPGLHPEPHARAPQPVVRRASAGSTSHDSPVVELGEPAGELAGGGLDDRADHRREVGRRPDPQAAHGVGEPAPERRVVVQRRLDDGQARRRALLPGVAERRAHEVAQGEVEVGGLADHHRVLAARLGDQAQRRLPVEEHPRRLVGAGEGDGVDVGVGDEMPADVVVGAAHELDDVGRHARLVDVAHQLDRRGDRLGGRLEQHGVAGGEGGDDAVGRDRDREVPRSGDEHDAERVGVDAVGGELVDDVRAGAPPSGRSRPPRRPRGRPRARSCPSRGPSPRSCGRGWPP